MSPVLAQPLALNTHYDSLIASIRSVGTLGPAELQAMEQGSEQRPSGDALQVEPAQAEVPSDPSGESPPIPSEVCGVSVCQEPAPAAIPFSGSGSGPAHSSRQPAEVTLH